MPQIQLHTTCDDCVSLVQHAATIISSSLKAELPTLYDAEYQSRLLANAHALRCHMCTLLHAQISWLSEPLLSGEVLELIVTRASHDPLAVTIRLRRFEVSGSAGYGYYGGELRVQEAGHGNVQILDPQKTWSLKTLKCIHSWLKSCTSYHDMCSKPKGSDRLPLRLLDVNATDTIQIQPIDKMRQEDFDQLRLENSHGVRIVSTKSLSPNTEYLTLSHRWGNPPSILLSQQTSFLLTEDVSPHLLGRQEAIVFQHAIHVTRCLGFRYIWIDALCIMQDDGPEREAEVMQMDGIYFNSKLNISAAEADISKGLVFDRKPLLTNPCIIPVKVPGTQVDMSLYVFHDKWFLGPWDKPLDKRGWVFQERILSPRIIHFTQDQVFWECRSFEASEVLPRGGSAPQLERLHKSRFNKSIGIDSTTFNAQETKSRWYELVTAYSGTSLSFADDRLLAISAMAKRFCSAMRLDPADYLAGMWKDDLPLSMIWLQEPISERSGPSENRPDLGIKNVPSWSWASIMAEITTMNLSPLTATPEVINIEVQRRSRNFFDGTDVCRLGLRGPLCKFRRHSQGGSHWIEISDDTTFQELDDFDFQADGSISIYWDTARKFRADEYFLLHVATNETDEEPMEHGLVLLRTAECGTYKRVGSFVIPNTSDYSDSKLKDAFEGNLDTLSTDDYLDVDSDGKYVIDVV